MAGGGGTSCAILAASGGVTLLWGVGGTPGWSPSLTLVHGAPPEVGEDELLLSPAVGEVRASEVAGGQVRASEMAGRSRACGGRVEGVLEM